MPQCKPASTPVTTSSKLCVDAGSPYDDHTLYRSLAGVYSISLSLDQIFFMLFKKFVFYA